MVAAGSDERQAARARGAALLLDRLRRLLADLCGLILALLLALMLSAVVLRYGFATGITGSDELAVWLNVALIGFGAPLAAGGLLSMRLDVVTRRLSGRAGEAAAIITTIVTLAAGLALGAGGGAAMAELGGHSTALGLPEWLRLAPLAAGGGLTVLVVALEHLADGRAARFGLAALLALGLHYGAPQLDLAGILPPSLSAGLVAAAALAAGAPLPHALIVAVHAVQGLGGALDGPALVSVAAAGVSKLMLTAIPFFLLAGGLFVVSGLVARLVRLASALVGHRVGGVAQTTLVTGLFFSCASGSSIANAAFSARLFVPALVARGHARPAAGAIVAASSVLDNVVPPSIAFLILAAATGLSVGKLMTGGLAAGLVMALALAISIRLTAPRRAATAPAPRDERLAALVHAVPALGLGLIVVAGIRLGVVTPGEAAAFAALYTLLACPFRGAAPTAIGAAFGEAAVSAASIGLLIAAAAPFAFLVAVDDLAGHVASLARLAGGSPLAVLLFANFVLIAAGMVLDIGAAILLLAPMLLPLALAAGLDPVGFGVVLVVNLMIGGLTPPVGVLAYVVGGVADIPAAGIFRALVPHVAALLAALALLSAALLLAIPFHP